MNYVTDQIVDKLLVHVKKKQNKGGVSVKPFQIRNHLWVFINCLIENPSFDSQTKENMTLRAKAFGSTCELNDKFIKSVCILQSSWKYKFYFSYLNKFMNKVCRICVLMIDVVFCFLVRNYQKI